MKILIKSAKIIDKHSPFNGMCKDLLINNGKIEKIADKISEDYSEKITSQNLHISPSWADIRADFCEPGNEYREDLKSGAKLAIDGGFVYISLVSSTSPSVFQNTTYEFISNKFNDLPIKLLPYSCITKDSKGEQLAEMYDMFKSGARLFSDDLQSLSSGLVYRALLYVKSFNGKLALFCRNPFLSKSSQINEGLASLKTGLKGEPKIAETIDLERYISLLEYTDSSLHISGISCEESLNKIIAAKHKGLKITADVHLENLLYNDENLINFDRNFKLLPVLRTENDRKALVEGVKNGYIDGIASNHRPFSIEETEVEFDDAPFGCVNLQTFFPQLLTVLPLKDCIEILAYKNKEISSIQTSSIKEGNFADLTCFDPSINWKFDSKSNLSKSKNSPLFGKEMTGKALATIFHNKSSLLLNSAIHNL